MGRAKAEQMERQEKVGVATSACVDFGAIEECENHEGIYIDTGEFMEHEELADQILDEDPVLLGQFKDKEEFVECVKEAMDSAGEECPMCAKNRES